MFYTIPTKRGLGIQLWGTYGDLRTLYNVISQFWGWDDERFAHLPGFENRNKLISGFSYELRKACEGQRLTQDYGLLYHDDVPYFGCEVSWPHVLFSLAALRYNMRHADLDRLDLALFLQFEYWLRRSMEEFDKVAGAQLAHFLEDGIYAENPYMYHYMRSINTDYFKLGGGKRAFKKLPDLMSRASFPGKAYSAFRKFLEMQAARLGGEVEDLEMGEGDEIYEIKW